MRAKHSKETGFGHLAEFWRRFCLDVVPSEIQPSLGGLRQDTAPVGDDYFLIAARSGWTPLHHEQRR